MVEEFYRETSNIVSNESVGGHPGDSSDHQGTEHSNNQKYDTNNNEIHNVSDNKFNLEPTSLWTPWPCLWINGYIVGKIMTTIVECNKITKRFLFL